MTDMDTRLWALISEPGGRLPLLSRGEAQAALELLLLLAAEERDGALIARDLATALARRLPAEE